MIVKYPDKINNMWKKVREQEHEKLKLVTPQIVEKNGMNCYFDPIRRKYVRATAEETVRQEFLLDLLHNEDMDEQLIKVEESLSHYIPNLYQRADIVLLDYSKKDGIPTIPMVVECKAPENPLGHWEVSQLLEYGNYLKCTYALLTNGEEIRCFSRALENAEFQEVEELPLYDEIISNKYVPTSLKEEVHSEVLYSYEELVESVTFSKNEWFEVIGSDTEFEKAIPALNLQNCLMNIQEPFGNIKSDYFDYVSDLELRDCHYGNAGYGKNAYSGLYRTLEISRNGNTEFINIRLWGVERGYTSLCVGHDSQKLKSSNHALQYQLDKFLQIESKCCRFVHDGTMSRIKRKDLWAYTAEFAPHLLSGEEFFIGELNHGELYHLASENMTKFITRLIEYALIRDDFKQYRRKNRDLF